MKKFVVAILFAGIPFAQNSGETTTPPDRRPAAIPAPADVVRAPAPRARVPFSGGSALDAVIEDAVRTDQIPGAVLIVGHEGRIVYEKAYGSRALVPRSEPMTLDTVFDVASLTKVVATTSSIMKLVERGKVRLNDRVIQYIPEFQHGRSEVTVRNLLTHFSGLRPFFELESGGYEAGIRNAVNDTPAGPPNVRFVYSDINFILLGEIVRRTSGMTLAEFAGKEIFRPLGMADTMFQPPAALLSRIAPTEYMPGSSHEILRGIVHDPRARNMGGIAGHAGLFSTARDLAKFAQMILDLGERNGVRVFSPLTIRVMTSPQSPAGQTVVRGLGWDIDSTYSSSRGDLYPLGSFGHTGFTGTSVWIDPVTRSYVILLSNSVHPKLRPAITPLRSKVASAAAAGLDVASDVSAALSAAPQAVFTSTQASTPATQTPAVHAAPARPPAPRNAQVLTGIDVLVEEKFESLRGKRVGLITNHTGITRYGRRNIDVMLAGGVKLKALFSPEHGISGTEDHEKVANTKDAATGLPVYSLYFGSSRQPKTQMLAGIDVLIFDIQDVGARFYTYVCTMVNAMEEAAKHKLEFVILDRPNPINGIRVEGPTLEPGVRSFIGCIDMPIRHGMTVGELALMVNASRQPKTNVRVVKMKNWRREDWFDSTGLIWIDPSPNMRGLNAAVLYPGIGMLEGAKVYSVGRGTDAPFEQVGADWINGVKLSVYLNERHFPGIRIYPTILRPTASNFKGKTIEGVRFVITDRDVFSSTGFGIELGVALAKLFPGHMTWAANEKLAGGKRILAALSAAEEPAKIEQGYAAEVEEFRVRRSGYLLY
jgi:uncharacterized protein YbbC (DUF1343 family)/CubicO group peptidase (beta-lactamase class C family)